MQYYVTGSDGQEYGPVDLDTLKTWVADNRVQPNSKVRNSMNGMVLAASTMPEVSNLFPEAPVPGISTVAPMAGYQGVPSYNQAPDFKAMQRMDQPPYQEFWILMGLSVLEVIIGATVGFFSIVLGIYVVKRAWEAHENGEKGAILALIIAIVCVILGNGIRLVYGSMLRRAL
jgi:hypothetical protein